MAFSRTPVSEAPKDDRRDPIGGCPVSDEAGDAVASRKHGPQNTQHGSMPRSCGGSVRRLPLPLARGAREISSDYLSRLAFRHGRDSLYLICGDFGLRFEEVCKGEAASVRAVAELGDCDPLSLLEDTFQVQPDGRWRYRNELFLDGDLTRSIVRVCPDCLQDDLDGASFRPEARPYRRGEWCLRSVRTCTRHHRALVALNGRSTRQRHETSRILARAIGQLPSLQRESAGQSPTRFERYLLERLASRPPPHWLNRVPAYAAIQSALMLGLVSVHGSTAALASLSDEELRQCEEAGYDALSDGRDGIVRLVHSLQASHRRTTRECGPPLVLGPLHHWLRRGARDPAYDELKEIVRDACVEVFPLGAGDRILGREVLVRHLHSIHTAHEQYGVPVERLQKLLVAAGFVPASASDSPPHSVRFDAAAAEDFFSGLKDTLNLQQAAAYVGIPERSKHRLLECGVAPVIMPGVRKLKEYVFRTQDLNAFVEELSAWAQPGYANCRGLVGIVQAAQRVGCPLSTIVELVRQGRLREVGRKSRSAMRLSSLLVSVDEVRRATRGNNPEILSQKQACRELGLEVRAIHGLCEAGALSKHPNPVASQPPMVFRSSEVRDFQGVYVNLGEVAKTLGRSAPRTRANLTLAGIHPGFDPDELGVYIYRRKDVADL